MSEPNERCVTVGGCRCRVWEKGRGPRVGYFAGFRGVPRWRPFLDQLAENHTVVVPSLPGFPGAEPGHLNLDDSVDWITMALELLEASGLDGADLIAESVAGMLAAEVAALVRSSVRRLVLISSLGLYDAEEPIRNPYHTAGVRIPSLLTSSFEHYFAALGCLSTDPAEVADWEVMHYRSDESAARLIWPFGDRGLIKRLHRIGAPTLIVWGEQDQLVPPTYADRFAAAIENSRVVKIPNAGHLATIDAPEATAAAIVSFLK